MTITRASIKIKPALILVPVTIPVPDPVLTSVLVLGRVLDLVLGLGLTVVLAHKVSNGSIGR